MLPYWLPDPVEPWVTPILAALDVAILVVAGGKLSATENSPLPDQ